MTDLRLSYSILEQLGSRVAELARPIVPPRRIDVGDKYVRLEFQQHLPHTVMIGKLVRIASGTRAAFVLAEAGFVTECGALLRIVSDFCTEVGVIGRALSRGGQLPGAGEEFVRQYFLPKQRTPEEYAAAERVRHVSREDLMKSDIRARIRCAGALKGGDACVVTAGTHAGKSGTVRDINTSKTGAVTITVVQANGGRVKTLAKNVSRKGG